MATRAGVDEETEFLVDPRPRNIVISSVSLRFRSEDDRVARRWTITRFFSGIGVVC